VPTFSESLEQAVEAPKQPLDLKSMFKKGSRLPVTRVRQLGINLMHARKEVKNAKLVRNLISSYEDRHLALISFQSSYSKVEALHLVVLELVAYNGIYPIAAPS